jgi:hypothetical protein
LLRLQGILWLQHIVPWTFAFSPVLNHITYVCGKTVFTMRSTLLTVGSALMDWLEYDVMGM